jgi:drug/metabolite transporter (DMT)-like permease
VRIRPARHAQSSREIENDVRGSGRLADYITVSILGWRSLFSVITLGLFVVVQNRSDLGRLRASLSGAGFVSIAISVVSSVSYIVALRLTSVANVMTIYAALPFIATALAYFRCGESVSRQFLICCAVTVIGIAIMAGAAATARDILGIVAALVMTGGFASQLVHSKMHASLDMSFIITLAAFACILIALPLMQHAAPSFVQLLACALYGTLTTGFAYVLVLLGGRYISSGEAAFVSLLDVILGPIWVWVIYAETPSPVMLFGGALVLISVVWYLARSLRESPASSTVQRKSPPTSTDSDSMAMLK